MNETEDIPPEERTIKDQIGEIIAEGLGNNIIIVIIIIIIIRILLY